MLSLSELAKIHKKKLKSKTKTYDVILTKCHMQIKNMANRDQTFCYYIVPLYVLGLPLYDINACIVYLLMNLKKKGFVVQMADNHTIYVSWKHIHKTHNSSSSSSSNRNVQQRSIKPKPRSNRNDWSQQNQRYIQQRQITYQQPTTKVDRLLEHSRQFL